MEEDIGNKIIDFMDKDRRRDYTIPEVMAGLRIKSREKIIASLALLEGRGIVEIPRKKGRVKYYRLK